MTPDNHTAAEGAFLSNMGPREQGFLQRTFALLRLPLPEPEEFLTTDDSGRLVLVDPAACVVRVSYKNNIDIFKKEASRHDRLLQPLGRIEEDGLIVDVYPGILVPAMHVVHYYSDPHWLQQTHDNRQNLGFDLYVDGYDWRDEYNPFNTGYLPGTQTPDDPAGYAVILDPGRIFIDPYACKRTLKAFGKMAEIAALEKKEKHEGFYKNNVAPVQDALYSDLRQAFHGAADGTAENMEIFWHRCADAKKSGRLVDDWHETTYCEPADSYHYYKTPHKLPKISRAYGAHLSRDLFFANLL
jgi:hypothetical protein